MSTVTISSEQFRQEWGRTVDSVLSGQEVVIERYNRPSMVLVKYEQHELMRKRLAELEKLEMGTFLHERAKKIIDRNNANDSWVSHAQLMTELEEAHGPDFIAAIHEGVADNVAS